VCINKHYFIEMRFPEAKESERVVITEKQILNLIFELMKSVFACFNKPKLLLNNLSKSSIELITVQIVFLYLINL